MKLMQLNENEIKIILSKEDLSELDLTLRTIDYNTTKTRKAIWEIFDRARTQTGFDAAKNRVYVKLYPLSDGGCEMYVSKLDGTNDGSIEKNEPVAPKRQIYKYAGSDCAFYFEDFDSLYCACRNIATKHDSSLYSAPQKGYILLFRKVKRADVQFGRWNEFALPIKNKYISAYLNEHCKLLCPNNAVEKVAGKG